MTEEALVPSTSWKNEGGAHLAGMGGLISTAMALAISSALWSALAYVTYRNRNRIGFSVIVEAVNQFGRM